MRLGRLISHAASVDSYPLISRIRKLEDSVFPLDTFEASALTF